MQQTLFGTSLEIIVQMKNDFLVNTCIYNNYYHFYHYFKRVEYYQYLTRHITFVYSCTQFIATDSPLDFTTVVYAKPI